MQRTARAVGRCALALALAVQIAGCAPAEDTDAGARVRRHPAAPEPSSEPFVKTFAGVSASSLTVAKSGEIVIAGAGSASTFTGAPPAALDDGSIEGYVAALDPSGTPRWARRIASVNARTDVDLGLGLELDCAALDAGRVGCAGFFAGGLELGDVAIGCEERELCPFAVGFDDTGRIDWVHHQTFDAAGARCDNSNSITTVSADAAGDLVVVRARLSDLLDQDCPASLERFDRSGRATLRRSLPAWTSTQFVQGRADDAGNVFLVGDCVAAHFDGLATGCASSGVAELVVKLDPAGVADWVTQLPWTDPVAIAVSDAGVVVVGEVVPPGYTLNVLPVEVASFESSGRARYRTLLPWKVDVGFANGGVAIDSGGRVLSAPPQYYPQGGAGAVDVFALDGAGRPTRVLELLAPGALVAFDPEGRAVIASSFEGTAQIDGQRVKSKASPLLVADFAY